MIAKVLAEFYISLHLSSVRSPYRVDGFGEQQMARDVTSDG